MTKPIQSVFDKPFDNLNNEQICFMLKAAADAISDTTQASTATGSLLYEAIRRIERMQQDRHSVYQENTIFRGMLQEFGPKCRVCGVSAEPTVIINGGICNDCKSKEGG
jgi:hypothetical protein